jgi:hypothetical protein
MTTCPVTSVVILPATATLLLHRTSEDNLWQTFWVTSVVIMSSSCTLVTTSNENSVTDGCVTSVVLAVAVVVFAAAAHLLQFQIRFSVKCFTCSVFILFFQINHKHVPSKRIRTTVFLWPVYKKINWHQKVEGYCCTLMYHFWGSELHLEAWAKIITRYLNYSSKLN